MKEDDEYCEICEKVITDDDYATDNVKVPINALSNDPSVHVDCENERLREEGG